MRAFFVPKVRKTLAYAEILISSFSTFRHYVPGKPMRGPNYFCQK